MINKNIQKGIREIKKISLTKSEKSLMLNSLTSHIQGTKSSVPSHFTPQFFFLKTPALILGSFLLIAYSGATIAYGAERSLPGSLLYPVKIYVNEPIQEALAPDLKTKLAVETNQAVARLQEADALQKQGRLTDIIKQNLSQKFNEKVNTFNTLKKEIEDTDGSTTATEIGKNFEAKTQPYWKVLHTDEKNIRSTSSIQKNIQISNQDKHSENSDLNQERQSETNTSTTTENW